MTAPPAAGASFNQFLEQVCKSRSSQLCVGLDPDMGRIEKLKGHSADRTAADIALLAMKAAADAAAPCVAAFKPNAAFYEAIEDETPLTAQIGHYLRDTYPEALAVCDAKRGDIGNTSAMYARAVFQTQRYQAITVNPLMGKDAVEPFLTDPTKGVFLLCLTSNPGADDFLLQDKLYLRIAEKAMEWNTNDNVGLVVGATRPGYLAEIRSVAPDLPLLIPGVGAQGGKLNETLDAINAGSNRRFLLNASRSVLYPEGATWNSYKDDVAAAARALRDEINAAMG